MENTNTATAPTYRVEFFGLNGWAVVLDGRVVSMQYRTQAEAEAQLLVCQNEAASDGRNQLCYDVATLGLAEVVSRFEANALGLDAVTPEFRNGYSDELADLRYEEELDGIALARLALVEARSALVHTRDALISLSPLARCAAQELQGAISHISGRLSDLDVAADFLRAERSRR